MADLLVSARRRKWPSGTPANYSKSKLLDEAYEAIDFFPELGHRGKWLRFTAALIRDEGGELIGAIETLEDITRRKKAKSAASRAQGAGRARPGKGRRSWPRPTSASDRTHGAPPDAEGAQQTTDHLSLLRNLCRSFPTPARRGQFSVTFVSSTIERLPVIRRAALRKMKNSGPTHIHRTTGRASRRASRPARKKERTGTAYGFA